ncbi:MAG: DUF3846 domain-containing protein [Bacilli bacterium]|nr:DUF3846 domain-containing protein [Bacilli bacterium]MDD4795780.1 DUF3846 domain-containing protein [Bacilli bacterium]
MVEKIKVLFVAPEEEPKEMTILNTLKTKQKLVKGRIEVCYILEDNEICLICNEEGKLNGSLPNRDIGYDVIYGNFIIVGDDYVNGDFISLTPEQIKKYKNYFNKESIQKTKNRVNAKQLVIELKNNFLV